MSHFENQTNPAEIRSPREKVILATAALKQIVEVVRGQGISVDIDPDGEDSLGKVLNGTEDEARILQPNYLRGWHSEDIDPGMGDFNLNIIFSTDGGTKADLSVEASLTLFFGTEKVNPGGALHVRFEGEENKWKMQFDNSSDPVGDKPEEINDLISKLGFTESEIEIEKAKALDTIKELASFMKAKLNTL